MKKIYTKQYLDKFVNKISYIEYHNKNVDNNKHSFTLYWFTDYIPGHPDGEHKFHWRGQGFVSDPTRDGFNIPKELGLFNNQNEKVKDYFIDEKGRIIFLDWDIKKKK